MKFGNMKRLKWVLIPLCLVLLAGNGILSAQSDLRSRVEPHIETLADDKMEGREAGTPGEIMAAKYIAGQFKGIGLTGGGDEGSFFQEFDFFMERVVGEETGAWMAAYEKGWPADWSLPCDAPYPTRRSSPMPHQVSADGTVEGITVSVGAGVYAPDKGQNDYDKKVLPTHPGNELFKEYKKYTGKAHPKKLSGKIFLIDLALQPEDPHADLAVEYSIAERVKTAEKFGAAGVLLWSSDEDYVFRPDFSRKYARANLPVMWMHDPDPISPGHKIKFTVKLTDRYETARNVVAHLDRKKEHTIVIGAHYDHLGYGEHGGSLHRHEEREIHNGADDNASGTGMLIELARRSQVQAENYNYTFIAFSGEEKGLLGSNFYAKHPDANLDKVHAMINMDMVGRLDPDKKTLIINGVGSSPSWPNILDAIKVDGLKTKTSESGVGPSDHTSFYLKDVPVLHFFSGTHPDYHKPTDDEKLINYAGMDQIYDFLTQLTDLLEQEKKLVFTKTKEDDNENAPRFTVTLGVVPDYAFDGTGMRIDGITDGKTGSVAGMKTGDVVIQMGDHEVADMMSYMRALSRFKKGDETQVKFMREGKEMEVGVKFQ